MTFLGDTLVVVYNPLDTQLSVGITINFYLVFCLGSFSKTCYSLFDQQEVSDRER